MRTTRTLLAVVVVLSALLTACAIPAEDAGTEAAQGMAGHDHPMAAPDEMPDYVQAADARTQEAYRFAAANREAAEQVPCYCGCVGLGHVSSYDCYVAGERADGTLEYDAHASACTVCVDITQDQMRLMDGEVSMTAIRRFIDFNYRDFGPPTPLTADAPAEAELMADH